MLNKHIELIVCDLDGTLLLPDETLPKEASGLASALQKKDIYFTIATGRSWDLAKTYIEKLGIVIPFALYNGAIVATPSNILYSQPLDAMPIIRRIENDFLPDISVVIGLRQVDKVLAEDDWVRDQRKRFDRFHQLFHMEENKNEDIYKINIVDNKCSGIIANIAQVIIESFPDKVNCTIYGNREIEVVSSGCSKSHAIGMIAENVNSLAANTMFIGDNNNDIDAISYSGVGVAVGNASQRLKEASDYICKSNNTYGVFEAIEHFCGAW